MQAVKFAVGLEKPAERDLRVIVESDKKIGMEMNQARFQLHGLAKMHQCIIALSAVGQNNRKTVMCIRRIRLDGQRPTIRCDRRLELTDIGEDIAQIAVGEREVSLQFERTTVRGDGFMWSPTFPERICQGCCAQMRNRAEG